MTGPLVVEFVVAAPPAHAFAVWTRRATLWWPPDHTVSGAPARIEVEPRVGGRVVETGPDGAEHVWGRVLDWEPPRRLRLRWHLFFPAAEATEVEVTFAPDGDGTAVRLVQTGWERLGPAGPPRRERTGAVWALLAVRFETCVAEGGVA